MPALPRQVKTEDILRGKVFDVAVPFTKGRPFDFVQEIEDTNGHYRIVRMDDGLEGTIVGGKRKAEVLKVVTEIKLRPALIILGDKDNQVEKYPYTLILPLGTVSPSQKERPLFKKMMATNDVEQFHYLGNDTYITVNDPLRVFKNSLFERDVSIEIPAETVTAILMKLAQCIELERIPRCSECENNCKTCEFKLAASS